MAKYADIEPFYDWLADLMRLDTSSYPDHQTLMFYEIIDELDSLQEVVRCKDCRAYIPPTEVRDWGICRRHSIPMRDNNFCNYGERREHE